MENTVTAIKKKLLKEKVHERFTLRLLKDTLKGLFLLTSYVVIDYPLSRLSYLF